MTVMSDEEFKLRVENMRLKRARIEKQTEAAELTVKTLKSVHAVFKFAAICVVGFLFLAIPGFVLNSLQESSGLNYQREQENYWKERIQKVSEDRLDSILAGDYPSKSRLYGDN